MINLSFYNTLATNYAENLHESCNCLVEVVCKIEYESLNVKITGVSCPICKKEFPETLKKMNDVVTQFIRGLWRE